MAKHITRAEYREYLAKKKDMTVEELDKWLNDKDFAIWPCDCTASVCQGWQIGGEDND